MRRLLLLGLAFALVVLAAAVLVTRGIARRDASRVVIRGGEAGGLPRAAAHDEHMDQQLLEQAAADAAADGLEVMLVTRHGHLVFERFGHGYSADSQFDSGPFAQALLALLAGIATEQHALPPTAARSFDAARLRAAIESGTHRSYADYLGGELWSRLNGAAAWIGLPQPGAAVPADCCFHARALDWMRIAAVLLDEGRFEGTAIVPAVWIQRMRTPLGFRGTDGFGIELAAAARGREPFVVRDVFFLRGPGHWRLWLLPPYQVAVLFGADATGTAAWDETRLPNLVIRAIEDAPTPQNAATRLQQLVPGH